MRSHRTLWRRRQGLTLIELLVVMFILVSLAGVITVMVTKRVEEAKHVKAVTDIDSLKNAVTQYHLQNGAYPSTLEALRTKPTGEELPSWNGPYIEKLTDDPWGRPYQYVVPGEHNTDSFDLFTLGRDDREGGTGSDADVTNWDEKAEK